MNYQEYLKSKDWWRVRTAKLMASGYKCERCGFKHELDVHHLHYDTLGNENLCDLVVLCRRCHRDTHYFKDCTSISKKDVLRSTLVTKEEYEKQKAVRA